ncbi:DNA translocase FtsK 4TM domain-containing protein [Alkalimonas sp. MEB108]|uniref:DNA translocase FtsK n=1 Tax=Alkalimonas cellulosilytica TaxID=3058395 RepID=A0ABU7J9W7_9GAMM|nr:DNA translocase FtsK 4TM domain-containing protein [Alkalimonas sp. MEB108]MEE2003331.1 DNA translocase FtsK 4TM domain-containing protein [Alkalimonas sp. MEB108]
MPRISFFNLNGIQRLLEVGLILCCGLALFLLLALISFNPADPSWSQTGYQHGVSNYAGPVGAWLADLLLFSFGWIAYLIPVLVAGVGYLLFKRFHHVLELDYLILGLRLIGLLLTMISATAISSMNFNDIYYFSSGGVVGDVFSGLLLPYLNFVGTTLLLLCFFATGLTLMTGISWFTVMDALGAWVWQAGCWLLQLPSWLQDKWQQNQREVDDSRDSKQLAVDDEWATEPNLNKQPVSKALTTKAERNDFTLPVQPLEERDARAFYSVDDLADESLSFSAVDEPELPEQIEKTLRHTEIKPKAVRLPEPEPDEDDSPESEPHAVTELPGLELLDRPDKAQNPIDPADLERVSRLVEAKLLDFNVEAKVVGVHPGPVVTRFELDLAPGVKVSKITGLAKDLARSLSAISVRVVEVIPGKSFIGLELPNKHREIVRLSEVIGDTTFEQSRSPLTMVLGKDIAGKAMVADLAKMPHLLVAGTTGSGKSVGVNVMICSILYKSTPDEVRFLMIDPKMLELSIYEGIPHLLTEVVTDMKDAANGLRWCVGEMERRYKLMSALGVRNLKGYNAKVKEAIAAGQPLIDPLWKPSDDMRDEAPRLEKLPAIVVVIDEFADMMMIVGKKVEELIARIAQKARAAGIHLILATQRPSVDVITGLIKANIPTRIAFQVSSKIDSRTILDQQGAESLLGQGDMLYLPPGSGVPNRVHGAFVDDHEVHAVVADWKRRGQPKYIAEILSGETTEENLLPGETLEGDEGEADPLYDQAVAFVTESRRASVSGVQRRFRIGYNRAARLVEQMEHSGVVSGPGHNGNREVLAPPPPKGN